MFGIKYLDDVRQISRWKGIVFTGKLSKMINDATDRFDDYSILPVIRQVLLHWVYELVWNNLYFIFLIISGYIANKEALEEKVSTETSFDYSWS